MYICGSYADLYCSAQLEFNSCSVVSCVQLNVTTFFHWKISIGKKINFQHTFWFRIAHASKMVRSVAFCTCLSINEALFCWVLFYWHLSDKMWDFGLVFWYWYGGFLDFSFFSCFVSQSFVFLTAKIDIYPFMLFFYLGHTDFNC